MREKLIKRIDDVCRSIKSKYGNETEINKTYLTEDIIQISVATMGRLHNVCTLFLEDLPHATHKLKSFVNEVNYYLDFETCEVKDDEEDEGEIVQEYYGLHTNMFLEDCGVVEYKKYNIHVQLELPNGDFELEINQEFYQKEEIDTSGQLKLKRSVDLTNYKIDVESGLCEREGDSKPYMKVILDKAVEGTTVRIVRTEMGKYFIDESYAKAGMEAIIDTFGKVITL